MDCYRGRVRRFSGTAFLSLVIGCAPEPALGLDDGVAETLGESGSKEDTGFEAGPSETAGECQLPLPVCTVVLDCVEVVAPDALAELEAQFGESSDCWCSGDGAAAACAQACQELLGGIVTTEPACQLDSCPLEELDPRQPYGPVVDGVCPDYNNGPQQPFINPLGLPGSFCAPIHGGITDYCPDHEQTVAKGEGYLIGPDNNSYCALLCTLDHQVGDGPQCPCGARCQPVGSQEGKGICTWEGP